MLTIRYSAVPIRLCADAESSLTTVRKQFPVDRKTHLQRRCSLRWRNTSAIVISPRAKHSISASVVGSMSSPSRRTDAMALAKACCLYSRSRASSAIAALSIFLRAEACDQVLSIQRREVLARCPNSRCPFHCAESVPALEPEVWPESAHPDQRQCEHL